MTAPVEAPRYAIYYAPSPASALWRFGSAVIGYDAVDGSRPRMLVPDGFSAEDWLDMTREPRRYGFHATLKAPFSLSEGRSEDELLAMLRNVATGLAAATPSGLAVKTIGSFTALVPTGDTSALEALAFSVVRAFEPFRAPLSEADRRRRLESPLTPRQIEQLDRWGYPYVGEDFRFHMTLTGPLHADVRASVRDELARLHAERVDEPPFAVDRLCVFKQERRDGSFRIIGDVELA